MRLPAPTQARIRQALDRLADELIDALGELEPGVDEPERLLTVEEALQRLQIARSTFYQLVTEHRIRTIQVGKRRLVPSSAIPEFIAGQAVGGGSR